MREQREKSTFLGGKGDGKRALDISPYPVVRAFLRVLKTRPKPKLGENKAGEKGQKNPI